jgi:hypothetical protein
MADDVDTFFNNYGNTGATSGSYTNKVYFGATKPKKVTMKRSGQVIDVPGGDDTLTTTEAKRLYLTDESLRNSWNVALRKNGITADPIQARAIWDLSVDGASDWYATSNGQQKITPQQYLGWYAGGKKKTAPKPDLTRSVYQYAPEQIDADANEIAQKRLGRTINEEDRASDWYKNLITAISNMAAQGTVSTTKDIRNPKTGKLERVVTQTPKFTKEKATAAIESAVVAADPESLARKERVDFTKWFMSRTGGANG